MTAVAESESDSESSGEEDLVQLNGVAYGTYDGDKGIIDATTPPKGQCEERLWMAVPEMNWQMDKFSRTFDIQNYLNAVQIQSDLKTEKGIVVKLPAVTTWELLDKAFSFPSVRRFDLVQQNMDMLEHFQDNLNTNISNMKNVNNFIRVGKTVLQELNAKYADAGFTDPAGYDPRNPDEITWANAGIA